MPAIPLGRLAGPGSHTTQNPALGDGVRYGSVLNGFGDPETPGWPSVSNAHRLDHNGGTISALPKIPVQPIGYADARRILKELGGKGGLQFLISSMWSFPEINYSYRDRQKGVAVS